MVTDAWILFSITYLLSYCDIWWAAFSVSDSGNRLDYSTGQSWGASGSSFLCLLASTYLTSITSTWSIASYCTSAVSSEANTYVHTDSSQVVPDSDGMVADPATRTHHMIAKARDGSLPPRRFSIIQHSSVFSVLLMYRNLAPILRLRRTLIGLPLCKTNRAHCLTTIRGTLFQLLLIKRLLATNGSTRSNRSLMDR